MANETPKRTRKPRRNFAEERAKVITFCKLAIQIYTPLCTPDDADTALHGRIDGYREILRQLGEVAE